MDIVTDFINSFASNMGALYTTVVRWVFVFLALYILLMPIKSLLRSKNPAEIWGYLSLPGDIATPLRHWENVIGRAKSCDVNIDVMSVSRNHATLVRDNEGQWFFNDLGSKGGSMVNGHPITTATRIKMGDKLTLGGIDCVLVPASIEEEERNRKVRAVLTNQFSPWGSLIAISLFQILTLIQFFVAEGKELSTSVPIGFAILFVTMWTYCLLLRRIGKKAFEIEMIAFFLSTLSLAVTASSLPHAIVKQSIAIVLGVILFVFLCWFLRDLTRVMSIRKFLVFASVLLFIANIIFAQVSSGAYNWIDLGFITFQPSEFVKVAFIVVGAATLDELYEKVNLTLFIGFSLFCLGCLAVMNDFGTAAIFFITYLVISFLRSGEFSKLFLVLGAAGLAGLLAMNLRGHILERFMVWRHVWENSDGLGYQQTRTMTAGASGGLVGVGAGEGWLEGVAAANTDLVFGMLCEEWGLIIACLAVLAIITLGLFAYKSISSGLSAFYTIAACGATTLLIFQTILNVCGAEDILPLTGVTFPFVSYGGSSMIATWCMLAFLKAADTRQDASLAVRPDDSSWEGEDL